MPPNPTLTKKEVSKLLAETVHTAFRKGSDHPDAHKVWMAIRNMNPKAWNDSVNWMVWALFYAKERR